jgi:hypothetical protein
LVHVAPGAGVLPEPLSWILGGASLWLLVSAARRAGGTPAPALFTAVALIPLLAASWPVGARYFYLPAAGLAWATGEVLVDASLGACAAAASLLATVATLQAGARQGDVAAYASRLSAARRAVADGLRHGHRVFHVNGGIKDLDLAVKDDPAAGSAVAGALVLSDVPASFVVLPPDLARPALILVADPPLPPSGAYRFGGERVVGLARRGDDPSLDEVLARFPDLRLIRLRPGAGGIVIARDVTEELTNRDD